MRYAPTQFGQKNNNEIKPVNLSKILSQVKVEFDTKPELSILGDIEINDIQSDSRKILPQKNAIFFALDGETQNGADFISSAISKGARVIVAKEFCDDKNIISIKTENPFLLLVEFLKIFYPTLPTNIYAVTGTNGKTSTVEFVRQILGFLNIKSASIGTLGVTCDDTTKLDLESFDLTTPDIISLYKNLAILRANNINDVAIEVSSIGLKQARIAGLKIDAAGFTNFSQDHLDYHKTMDEYFVCKMLLFEAVLRDKSAVVLNADITEYEKIKKYCAPKKHFIFDYGFKAQGLKITAIKPHERASQLIELECVLFNNIKKYQIILNITGEFQVYNVLCALALVMAKHRFDEEKFLQLLEKLSSLKTAQGRMQQVATLKNNARIFIDFAHTPDALKNVLQLGKSLKIKDSRLIILFGCGGDRDNKKRALMGKIACDNADIAIVTDDNPRTENAAKIRAEIISGCDDRSKIIEIDDRKNAIKQAILMLREDDILILAGKGHEKYQIIGVQKFEFDEEKIVKNSLV